LDEHLQLPILVGQIIPVRHTCLACSLASRGSAACIPNSGGADIPVRHGWMSAGVLTCANPAVSPRAAELVAGAISAGILRKLR